MVPSQRHKCCPGTILVPAQRHKSCPRTILVLVPRHKSCPGAILVPVPRHKSCPRTILVFDPGNDQEYFKGSIRRAIVLRGRSWCLIQATTRNTLRSQSGERSWSRTILVLDPSNDQEYFKGSIRRTILILDLGNDEEYFSSPHIDRFHKPIRINDPAHITIDSTFNLSI